MRPGGLKISVSLVLAGDDVRDCAVECIAEVHRAGEGDPEPGADCERRRPAAVDDVGGKGQAENPVRVAELDKGVRAGWLNTQWVGDLNNRIPKQDAPVGHLLNHPSVLDQRSRALGSTLSYGSSRVDSK